MVVQMSQREAAKARRQRVVVTVVRDSQGALKLNGAPRVVVDFGKSEHQFVVLKRDHCMFLLISLPFAVPHLAHYAKNGVVRRLL